VYYCLVHGGTTDTFLLREALEAVGEVRRCRCVRLTALLLLLTDYRLLDADVISHVISTASRQPVYNKTRR